MQDVEDAIGEHQRPRQAAGGNGGDAVVAGQDFGFETGGWHGAIVRRRPRPPSSVIERARPGQARAAVAPDQAPASTISFSLGTTSAVISLR